MIRRALALQRRLTGESFFGTVRRYMVFLVGGTIGWLILIGLHSLLHGQHGFHPAISYGIGDSVAVIFTFIYHIFVTFRMKTNWQARFVQFAILTTGIAFANWGSFYIGRVILDLPVADIIMSFFITGFLSAVNFLVNRIVIFKHH